MVGRELADVLEDVRRLAIEYYDMTGRPLGCTGELAECAAAKALNLKLSGVRSAGFDAKGMIDGVQRRIQIKGRRHSGNKWGGQRIGKIDLKQPFDSVVLVLMDAKYQPIEMHFAVKADIEQALTAPGSKARNERGALSVSKFRRLGKCIWRNEPIAG